MFRLTTIIPVYNGAAFLRETLNSIAAQTCPPNRVVVLDNASTDGTDQLVQGYHGLDGLELRRHERTLRVLENFNCALEYAASTDALHILSADDLIEPPFFERLLPHFHGVSGRALAFTGLRVIDENGAVTRDYPQVRGPACRLLTRRQFLTRQMELRHVYCQSVLLKTARQPAPVRFREDWTQAADVLFFSEWAMHCERIVEVRQPLCRYRLHSASITGGNLSKLDAWVMEEWRAMRAVQDLLPDQGASWWIRRQKLKAIFAARSRVKMDWVGPVDPMYAREIGRRTRQTVGPGIWLLAGLAVRVRDLARGLRRRSQRATLPRLNRALSDAVDPDRRSEKGIDS
jgi:glycosyltransferase involved in cell wall biosynthesis